MYYCLLCIANCLLNVLQPLLTKCIATIGTKCIAPLLTKCIALLKMYYLQKLQLCLHYGIMTISSNHCIHLWADGLKAICGFMSIQGTRMI